MCSSDLPLLIEMCFQTAGLYEAGATGNLALPQSIGLLKVFNQPVSGVEIYSEVKPRLLDGNYVFDARVIDAQGHVYLEMRDYRTSALPYPAERLLVEPFRKMIYSSND